MNDQTTSLGELRELIERFVDERRWQKFHTPKNLASSIAIEAAELLEHFQWLSSSQVAREVKQAKVRRQIAEEMADVLAYLLALSNALDIDLSRALERKVCKNATKYPAKRYRGRFR